MEERENAWIGWKKMLQRNQVKRRERERYTSEQWKLERRLGLAGRR